MKKLLTSMFSLLVVGSLLISGVPYANECCAAQWQDDVYMVNEEKTNSNDEKKVLLVKFKGKPAFKVHEDDVEVVYENHGFLYKALSGLVKVVGTVFVAGTSTVLLRRKCETARKFLDGNADAVQKAYGFSVNKFKNSYATCKGFFEKQASGQKQSGSAE